MLSIIAVIGKNRELGKNNKLLWHVPGDLPRFKKLTTGHPVIMGRKTYESIGTPLSGRTNIVISKSAVIPGATVVRSFDEAVEVAKKAPGSDEMFVIGGGSVYAQAIDQADRLYLTVVDKSAPDADTFFPVYKVFTKTKLSEDHNREEIPYVFYILER